MNQISDFDKSPRTPMSKSPLALTPPKSPINEYKSPLPMQDLNIAKKLIQDKDIESEEVLIEVEDIPIPIPVQYLTQDFEDRNQMHIACLQQAYEQIYSIILDIKAVQFKVDAVKKLEKKNNAKQMDGPDEIKEDELDQLHSGKSDLKSPQRSPISVQRTPRLSDRSPQSIVKSSNSKQQSQNDNSTWIMMQDYYDHIMTEDQIDTSQNMTLKQYLNLKDKFGNTPFLLCCIKPTLIKVKKKKGIQDVIRYECLKKLEYFGAIPYYVNRRSLWSPLHWCAFNNDYKSIEFITKLKWHKRPLIFIPDNKGQYPFDLNDKNHNNITSTLLEEFIDQIHLFKGSIDTFETSNSGQLGRKKQQINKISDPMQRFMIINFTNPVTYSKVLYKIATMKTQELSHPVVSPENLYNDPFYCVYGFAPIETYRRRNAYHAAAQSNNQTFLTETYKKMCEGEKLKIDQISKIDDIDRYFKLFYDDQPNKKDIFNLKFYKKFKSIYLQEIQIQYEWYVKMNFNKKQQDFKNKAQMSQFIDYQDIDGNTPIHLATLKGHQEIISTLLSQKSNVLLENEEKFKPYELSQVKDIKLKYKEHLQQLDGKLRHSQVIENIYDAFYKVFQLHSFQDGQNAALAQVGKQNQNQLSKADNKNTKKKDIFTFGEKLFVPDLVLKVKIEPGLYKKNNNDSKFLKFIYIGKLYKIIKNWIFGKDVDIFKGQFFFDIRDQKQEDDSEYRKLESLNMQISILLNYNFEVYIMKSYLDKGFYFLMLSHKEGILLEQAEKMNLQAKLMDSYDLEQFKKDYANLFEPFRSRQRQQVILDHFLRSLNYKEFIKKEIFQPYYLMHKEAALHKIQQLWLGWYPKQWYKPSPLNLMSDYFSEGQQQKFTSISTLRLYFGEKISFYFGWKSYITCWQLILGLPGLILQLYILVTGDYEPRILPWWVVYVSIWSTVQVEIWKRKQSEITTRWGCLDLMEADNDKSMRPEFQGYEEIYQVTGQLTRHQQETTKYLKSFMTGIMMFFFIFGCIFIFIGVTYLKDNYAQGNTLYQILLSVVQAAGIFILNTLYTIYADWSGKFENHKYKIEYEKSLIYKNSAFKFFNSYLSVFLNAFYYSESELSSLFSLLLPVLIAKQGTFLSFNVILPSYLYQKKVKNYRARLQRIKTAQKQVHKSSSFYKDGIEQFYEDTFESHFEQQKKTTTKARQNEQKFTFETAKRAVLCLQKNILNNNSIEGKLEENLDVDSVELNGLKLNFEGTLNYFMEGILDLGYITLFAAAFPIGPVIAVVANVVEINIKLYALTEVYKRPETERCGGIGEWVNIMEIMGLVSVFTNFALLYVKTRKATLEALYGYYGDNNTTIILLYFLTIILILIIKIIVKWLIPDIPKWVLNEIKKLDLKQHVDTGQQDQIKKKTQDFNTIISTVSKTMGELESKKYTFVLEGKQKQEQLEILEKKIKGYEKNNLTQNLIHDGEKKKRELIQLDLTQDQQIKLNGISFAHFMYIEWMLIQERIKQLDQFKLKSEFICLCEKKEAVYDCLVCEQNYCQKCYDYSHIESQHHVMLLKPIKFYEIEDINYLYNQGLVYKHSEKPRADYQQYKENKKEKLRRIIDKQDSQLAVYMWTKFQKFDFRNPNSLEINQLVNVLDKIYRLQICDEKLKPEIKLHQIIQFSEQYLQTDKNQKQNAINDLYTKIFVDGLNIEDLIWINRIAYYVYKQFDKFDNCKEKIKFILKDIDRLPFPNKLEILFDICDLDSDGIIIRSDIEQILNLSYIQKITIEDKKLMVLTIDSILGAMFYSKETEKLDKASFTEAVLNQCPEFGPFRELLQYRYKK
ncbi:hypothetical protein pb186bvf_013704 [Paramecium bursaria]